MSFKIHSILQFKILKPLIDEVISGDSKNLKPFLRWWSKTKHLHRFRGGKKRTFDLGLKENKIIKLST